MNGRKLDRSRIYELYLSGRSEAEIADELDAKSTKYIHKILRDSGLFEGRMPETDEYTLDIGKVRALARAGWSIADIEYEFGWKYSSAEIEAALCLNG